MALADKIAKQETKSEYSDGFIDIAYYSKDDLAKLSIGDFVKFSGTFYFNTITNIHISCDNKNFDITISYTPTLDKYNFNIGTKYQTTFKGIWGSFIVDLFDVESSLSDASEYKSLEDYFNEYDDIAQEVDLLSEGDSKSKDVSGEINPYAVYDKQIEDLTKQVDEGMTNLFDKFKKDENTKSTLDKLLEQQYWNTELADEDEDLSKKLTHSQNINKDLKKQVDTLSKQVETLTIDRDNLSNRVVSLQDKLNDARNLTEDNLSLSKQVETLITDKDNLSNQVKTLQSKLVDLADKLNKSRKQALEQHNQVVKEKNSNKDIIERYNNLFDVYNHLRKDYSALQENCKVLKTQNTDKNQVIKFLLSIVGILFLISSYLSNSLS